MDPGEHGTIRGRRASMRRLIFSLAATVLFVSGSTAQQNSVPQTGRQALLEMFFSKTPGTFVKHLPMATRAALDKSGALASLEQYSLMASQLQTQGQTLETFETGHVLLVGKNSKTGDRIEITVESDVAHGDQDDIALTFHTYKSGQVERTPFLPQMTFAMKQEAGIWTLNEISLTIHLPLADPDFLKAITDKVKPAGTTPSPMSLVPQPQVSLPPAGSDALVTAAMRSILTAEASYATTYPMVGFTCTLSDLDGFGAGQRSEHQAMLINSGLASGKKYGFVFTLSGCGASPAISFHLSAVPNPNTSGRKAFCADQSNVIRSSNDGNAAACFDRGTPLE
jgi:hypothetical protein